MNQVWKVSRIAGWDGWCSPCEREDRPLVLTRSGPSGLRSWLAGLGDDDRVLLLTCRVCGQWQVVPRREEDDPEILLARDEVQAAHEVLVHARAVDALVELLRREPVEAPAPVQAVAPVDAPAPVADAPVADAPVAARAVRAPRRPLVLVAPPPVSPEQRDAAAQVLAAALGRPAPSRACPANRARRRRGGPTPRRADRAVVRIPTVSGTATSITLPSVARAQVVVAVAA